MPYMTVGEENSQDIELYYKDRLSYEALSGGLRETSTRQERATDGRSVSHAPTK
jgi:hypothetical protein